MENKKPNYSTFKEQVQKEFNKAFAEKLSKDLTKVLGREKAADILSLITKKKIKIVNPNTFYRTDMRSNYDIGSTAFKDSLNLDSFITKVFYLIHSEIAKGRTDIDLSSIFIYLTHFRNILKTKNEYFKSIVHATAKALAGVTVTNKTTNPFYINIIPASMSTEISEKLQLLSLAGLWDIINAYLDGVTLLIKENPSAIPPEVRFIMPIKQNVRANQIAYLSRVYSLTVAQTIPFFKNIKNLDEYSEELKEAIETLNVYRGNEIKVDNVLFKLKDIKNNYPLLTYPSFTDSERRNIIRPEFIEWKNLKELNFDHVYPEQESFINTCYKEFSEVRVNCTGIDNFEEIEALINSSSQILMVTVRQIQNYGSLIFCTPASPAFLRINLCNVEILSTEIIDRIKVKEKELCSLFNKDFKIIINFSETAARSLYGTPKPTHVRIISDIHADINKHYNYTFDFKSDFVINCGDTSGDFYTTKDWIKTYMTEGVSVTGNHLGYTDLGEKATYKPRKGRPLNIQPKNGQQKLLEYSFSTSKTPVLSNTEYEFDDMIFLGNTLYTDFELFGEQNKIACMAEAASKINDFRYCQYFEKSKEKKGEKEIKGKIVPFTPSIHAELFKACVGWFRNRLRYYREHNNTKPIILVTHHIPTPYGVEEQYKNDPLSAAFASDLRWFLKENPEIRLWAYGHTHHPHQYIIGNCRFVCNPFGYHNENNFDVTNYGLRIPIKDIKSTSTWTSLLQQEIEEGKIKVYEE